MDLLELIKEKWAVGNLSTAANHRDDMLLYLVKAGSNLFGTATEKSDTDYRGIYQPGIKTLALGFHEKTLNDSTSNDKSKNTADDVDIDLWSLQYWLELLKKGDTGAMDLLFSISNKEAVLYCDYTMHMFFSNTDRLVSNINVQNCEWIRYARSQSVKYGLKGTRMKALEKVVRFFSWNIDSEPPVKLADYLEKLVEYVDDIGNCHITETDAGRFLSLVGKMHQDTTTEYELLKRVDTQWKEYGARAKQAMIGGGVDWKAVSHCMRAIYQTQELLETGKVVYPLKDATQILNIKQGKLSWPAVEAMIEMGLEQIKNTPTNFEGEWDQLWANHAVLTLYNLR